MRKIIAYLVSGVCAGALCAASNLEQASVTMPYAELASLLDRVSAVEKSLEDDTPKSPVAVVVHSAEYALNCEAAESPDLQASFSISNLSEEWQAVPLVPTSVVLTSVDPLDAKIVPRDGMLCALLKPGEDASIQLGLMGAGASASGSRRTVAEFEAVAAARSVLTIQHSGDPAAVVVTGAVGANTDQTVFGLPSSGGAVAVTLYEAQALEPAAWKGAAQYLVRDHEGELEVSGRVRLTALDNGRTTEAQLQLPPFAELRSLCPTRLKGEFEVEQTGKGPLIHLRWQDDAVIHREVHLKYTLPILSADEVWEVRGLSVASAAHWDESFYVLPFEGYAMRPVDTDWSDVGRVPNWMTDSVGSKALRSASAQKVGVLRLSAQLLPRLKISEATVSLAEYWTDVVAEGGMLHKAQVVVEHRAQSRYSFALPADGKLLACAVNGRPTNPLIEADGGLALVLPKVALKDAKTKVSYVYTTKGDKLDPVEGKAQLELPRTPLFIHEVRWQVQLPAEYQATALEGNVVIETGGANGKPICLSKQICDDEVPQANLHYTRKDLER